MSDAAKDVRFEMSQTQLAAIDRVVRSSDFHDGFEAFLNGLHDAAVSKLGIADTERDIFRAQGEKAAVKKILAFAKMRSNGIDKKGQNDA